MKKVKVTIENLVEVFKYHNKVDSTAPKHQMLQWIVEDMIQFGGMPVWERNCRGERTKISHLIQLNELVEIP